MGVYEWATDPYVMAITAGVAVVLVIRWKTTRPRKASKIYPRDTVILHQVGRGPQAPSMSPFPLKLETYLRMAKIPYQNVHAMRMSSKGKTPFITYNGQEVADSQLCINFLNRKLGINLNSHLSAHDAGVARAFLKLTEENLYWVLALQRWAFDINSAFLKMAIPQLRWGMIRMVNKNMKKQAHGHGIGRHSQQEVQDIGDDDMKALSSFLGEKHFFMGDDPCETDCALFGMLAQIKWHLPGSPQEKIMKGELTNLSEYCERMKDRFWPDWDDCITHNGTKKATK